MFMDVDVGIYGRNSWHIRHFSGRNIRQNNAFIQTFLKTKNTSINSPHSTPSTYSTTCREREIDFGSKSSAVSGGTRNLQIGKQEENGGSSSSEKGF